MSFPLQKPFQQLNPQTHPLIKSAGSSRHNLFLDLPIAWRLALGFVVAALVAALASGVVGILREQSLSKQTNFYHTLLQLNTSLTTGRSFLELMDSKLQQALEDASVPNPSHETVADDIAALNNLANLYAQTLSSYARGDLLNQHPDQLAMLDEAGDDSLAAQQLVLTSSAQRTWQFYQVAQQEIVSDISHGNVKSAQLVLQEQGQPTNADALSALQSLIQMNNRLASAVDDATNVEIHNQVLATLLAIVSAILAIALVGWFLSQTLVRRLRHLHHVTRAVEEGRINERVQVVGRDEIAEVSTAVNAMVDTIVGLLEETRQQRDALTGAAEHLFSDMRIVNAGDLRVSAIVSNDPIGMLANAFNFTVGRFRRFILRTSTTMEQLDVISRQSLERSNTFISLVRSELRDIPPTSPPSPQAGPAVKTSGSLATDPLRPGLRRMVFQSEEKQDIPLAQQIRQTQDGLLQETRDDLQKRMDSTRETLTKANLSVGKLSELISTRSGSRSGNVTEKMIQAQLQELVALKQLLSKLAWEIRQVQASATSRVTQIDAAFADLARLAAERPAPEPPEISETGPSVVEIKHQEFVRHAGSFAVEVNSLSKRLSAIIQEMRSSITPFRLEGPANMAEPAKAAGLSASEQPFSSRASGNLTSTW